MYRAHPSLPVEDKYQGASMECQGKGALLSACGMHAATRPPTAGYSVCLHRMVTLRSLSRYLSYVRILCMSVYLPRWGERRYCTGAWAQFVLQYHFNASHRAQPPVLVLRCKPLRFVLTGAAEEFSRKHPRRACASPTGRI